MNSGGNLHDKWQESPFQQPEVHRKQGFPISKHSHVTLFIFVPYRANSWKWMHKGKILTHNNLISHHHSTTSKKVINMRDEPFSQSLKVPADNWPAYGDGLARRLDHHPRVALTLLRSLLAFAVFGCDRGVMSRALLGGCLAFAQCLGAFATICAHCATSALHCNCSSAIAELTLAASRVRQMWRGQRRQSPSWLENANGFSETAGKTQSNFECINKMMIDWQQIF